MGNKIAYLIIDGAPSPSMRSKVDYLESKRIPAIWFCIGALLEQNADAAIHAIRKGFHLGKHSYDHPKFSDVAVGESYSQVQHADRRDH